MYVCMYRLTHFYGTIPRYGTSKNSEVGQWAAKEPMQLILLVLIAIILESKDVRAFSASNAALLSRLQTIQAELLVSIGRIPGTAMPPEWAASGAKLGFALEVEFTDEPADYEMTKERLLKSDALMGTKLQSVAPLNTPSFVSTSGKETIRVEPGAYGCQIQGLESRQYAFRFFVDFPDGAKRNDVELPAERVYFLSSCWLLSSGENNSLERARRRKDGITSTIQEVTEELRHVEQRIQDANLLQKVGLFADSMKLAERRGKLSAQLEELEQTYPLDPSKVVEGPNGIIFAKEGIVAVKRYRGAMNTKEQYHWIGKFTYNDFFEDDE